MKDEILKGLSNLERLLTRLPLPLGDELRRRIAELRELLIEQRPPRLVLVGRRGAGKSTLINAIFDQPLAGVGHVERGTLEPHWYSYKSERGELEVLDTRGIGEALRAGEPNAREAALAGVLAECRKEPPDAILFLIKAKEIESRTDQDVDDLARICDTVQRDHGAKLALIGVANQCDELSPPGVQLHAPDMSDRYKQKLDAVRVVEHKLSERVGNHPSLAGQMVVSLGVVAYKEWGPEGQVLDDLRWRIDDLVQYIFKELPAQAQVELARVSRVKKLQAELAKKIVHATAAASAAVAALPLPVADIAPIIALQVSMLTAIGYIGGRDLSPKTAAELLTALGVNVGAGYVFREIARGLVRWVFPGGGSAVSSAVAYAGTYGLGAAAIAYFIDGKSLAEAKDAYGRTRAKGDKGASDFDLN
ncbi:MAG: GTPase [Polyangiaceae bacterium]